MELAVAAAAAAAAGEPSAVPAPYRSALDESDFAAAVDSRSEDSGRLAPDWSVAGDRDFASTDRRNFGLPRDREYGDPGCESGRDCGRDCGQDCPACGRRDCPDYVSGGLGCGLDYGRDCGLGYGRDCDPDCPGCGASGPDYGGRDFGTGVPRRGSSDPDSPAGGAGT